MRLSERLVVFIFRPIYRTFFDRLVWWFLLKVKIFMLADVRAQLDGMEARLRSDDSHRRLTAMEERLRSVEANNVAQWDALEQLLLALFRQPAVSPADAKSNVRGDQTPIRSATDPNAVHAAAAGHIR